MNQFNYEEELGNYLVGSDFLQNSWTTILELYKQTPQTHQNIPLSVSYKRFNGPSDVCIIAFGCSPICTVDHLEGEAKDLVSTATIKETFNFPIFDFLGTSSSLHRAAVQLYQSLHAQLLQEKIDIAQPLIITGHALGGSVASLFTLWLLNTSYSKKDRKTKFPICLTFGSPLLANHGLQETISGRPSWTSCFVHVVSKQDRIPRLFNSAYDTIVTEASCRYKPFGLYLFCSESGVGFFSDPEFISELLGAFSSHGMQFIDYGSVLEGIKDNTIIRGTDLGGWDDNSLRTGIVLQLQAIGIHEMQSKQQTDDLIRRIEAKQKESFEHKYYVQDLDERLKKMKIKMRGQHLEWYRKMTRSRGGYYDNYKNASRSRDETLSKVAIVKHKESIKKYWKVTVEEAKKTDGKYFPYGFLMAGNNYRRMVEPLDIAEYYKKGQKDYLVHGRSEHYVLLEKWLKKWLEKWFEDRDPSSGRQRKRACTFSEDSCFWAYVEEALISLTMLKDEEGCSENEEIFRKLRNFEDYVMDSLNKLIVDPEIFLDGSSFMTWWSTYSDKKGNSYHSLLASYMRSGSYRAYS